MRSVFLVMLRTLLALAALGLAPVTHAVWNSSAQAPDTGKALHQESFRLAPGTVPANVVRLGEADAGEIDAVRRSNASLEFKRLQIGVGRDVPEQTASLSSKLQWVPVDGGMAAQWEVSSAGARALRIELAVKRLPDTAQIRVAGEAGAGTVYGPVTMADIAAGGSTWWSPVLEGDTAIVEVYLAPGAWPEGVELSIPRVSHLFVSPIDPDVNRLAKATGAGASEPCEVDLVCLSNSDIAMTTVGRAVAKMTFSDGLGGGTFLCSGTLLNPIGGSFTPYFYSATHCLSTQASASTLTTHWFYDRTGCGSGDTSPNYVQLPGGATLLYTDATSDALFLRLNQTPPTGAVYSGWDSVTLGVGVALTAVHHPVGDWKKVSLGSMGGFSAYGGGAGSDHIITLWNSTATGVTEGGSSGSGIFTAVGQPASEYRLRGGLHGGPSSCTATGTNLRDYYSRFDLAYPSIAQYLNPNTSCTYALSPGSQSVAAGAYSGSFSVTAGSGCPWSAISSVGWITTSSSGSGSGTVQYSVAANTASASRTGTVTVGGQTFTITQAAGQSGVSTTNVVANGGFESGALSWVQTTTSGQIITTDATLAHSGSSYAWLGGYVSGTDTLYQDVTIPANATQATLQFWYAIVTSESSSSTAYDTMDVTVNSVSTGATLATIASFSNLTATSAWVQSPAYNLVAFAGQTVRIKFNAINDYSNSTSFRIDDVALNVTTAASNHTALWWYGPAENGWGINLNHQGDIIFATLFTYDSTGAPMWLFMSNGAKQPDGVTYSGLLYRATGPAFNANPFTSITSANLTQVGVMSVTFSGDNAATLTYTVNSVPVTKAIQRQVYRSRAANCVPWTGSRVSLTNYQDLWWNNPPDSESGWGINITHQDDTLFATLFTYDVNGRDLWLFMSGGFRQPDGSFLGDLYTATGPAFNAQPFTAITAANLTKVGTMQLRFSDGENGTLVYSVGTATVTKQITRQVFRSPVPWCS